jgi:hypothetical protein
MLRIRTSSPNRRVPAASLDVVVPCSSEMNCISCHAYGEDGASPWHEATHGVTFVNDHSRPVWENRQNILILHDGINGTNLSSPANQPVLCASCHYFSLGNLNHPLIEAFKSGPYKDKAPAYRPPARSGL